jgi:hypothetical protein
MSTTIQQTKRPRSRVMGTREPTVRTVSTVVLLLRSLLIGTLARGELSDTEAISSAGTPQHRRAALRADGQPA